MSSRFVIFQENKLEGHVSVNFLCLTMEHFVLIIKKIEHIRIKLKLSPEIGSSDPRADPAPRSRSFFKTESKPNG